MKMSCALQDFGPRQRERQEHRVARRHVGDRDAGPLAPASGTAMDASVSAEPPNAPRSICMTRCSTAPSCGGHARGRVQLRRDDAGRSWKLSAWQRKPSARAIARQVAESSPPDTSTTAGRGVGAARVNVLLRHHRPGSLPQRYLCSCTCSRTVEPIGEDPLREVARLDLAPARREQHLRRQRRRARRAAGHAPTRSRRASRART